MYENKKLFDKLNDVLEIFGVSAPKGLDPNYSYGWSKDCKPIDFHNPVGDSYRIESVDEIKTIRLLPLILLPRIDSKNSRIELLFKKHPEWKMVLQSAECSLDSKIEDIKEKIAGKAKSSFQLRKVESILPFGGLFSFKKSPTYNESNCYVFPLFLLKATFGEPGKKETKMGGKTFSYFCKNDLEIDKSIFKGPNGDVYRAIERLYPGWSEFEGHAYEYDIAMSFAGEQREIAGSLKTEIEKNVNDVTIFFDENENLLGDDLEVTLKKIYSQSTRYALIIGSKEYIIKDMPKLEKKAILEEFQKRNKPYLILLKVDEIPISGIPRSFCYEPLSERNVKEVAQKISEKLKDIVPN